MKRLYCLLATFVLSVAESTAVAQICPPLIDLGAPAGYTGPWVADISGDGLTAVGSALDAAGKSAAVRWDSSGISLLGSLPGYEDASAAAAASADGSVIVGTAWDTSGVTAAFRWTAATGMQDIGVPIGFWAATGAGVSDDGSVVVGTAYPASSGPLSGFRWTAATGPQPLWNPVSPGDCWAFGVSGDGTVIVGAGLNSSGIPIASRWAGTFGQVLGVPAGGTTSRAFAANFDGSVVAGTFSSISGAGRAFRWREATSSFGVFVLPPGFTSSSCSDVSRDGTIFVGRLSGPSGSVPFRFDPFFGTVPGAVLQGFNSAFATAVSADGTTMVGRASSPGAQTVYREQASIVGDVYCRPASPNSTGCAGTTLARGMPVAGFGNLELTAASLPPGAFGFFITSRTQGTTSGVPNSQGTLCLGGQIGRFTGPGQLLNSGSAGVFHLSVDINSVPTPTGLIPIQFGETWNFQAWHRDANPGPTSNFTDAVSIYFL